MATQNASNINDAGIVYCNGSGVFAGNNLSAVTNTIASTDTDGDVIIAPNGTGGAVATTDLTVGNATQDVAFTINGASITGVISAESVDGADLGGIITHRHSATAGFGGHSISLRSRGTHASPTVVSDGDTLSLMSACGHDGTDYAQAAQILVQVDGTPGSDDMPGRIILLTSADGGQTPTEAMRITNEQKVGIGTTTPLDTLDVTGDVMITHTAVATDEHALEIDCNAAGFGDIKAIDVDYITGAISGVDEEACILVNVDESAASGGEIIGYEMLSTTEGTDTPIGVKTGVGIDALHQETGTFGDADNILNKAVDVTAALASGGAGNISIFVADNDTFTIGDAATFGEMEIILDTGASGAGVAPTFVYSTGGASTAAFTPVDGTNGFRNTGVIAWNPSNLTGWATATSGDYEIIITRTRNTLSTTPIIDELQIAALTEHTWDKNGDLTVNSIALTTDLTVANGGTGASTLTDNGVLVGSGTGAITALAVGTDGQLLVGSSAADPVFATVTSSDSSIEFTTGAGTLSIQSATATTTQMGATELSTDAESVTGTSDVVVVTPGTLTARLAAPGDIGQTTACTNLTVDNVNVNGATVSYGGTGGMLIDAIGGVSFPLQPCVLAQAANQTDKTGDGTVYTLQYTTEIVDRNADWDGTSTFTCPITGQVFVNNHLTIAQLTTSHTQGDEVLIASNRSITTRNGDLGAYMDATNVLSVVNTNTVDMDAADTFTITYEISNGTKVADFKNSSYLSVWLLG